MLEKFRKKRTIKLNYNNHYRQILVSRKDGAEIRETALKEVGHVAQLVECLTTIHKALVLVSSTE